MTVHFGEHLMIDGYGGSEERLNSKEAVTLALLELTDELRMRPLMEPMVIEAPDNHIKDPGGWSGFVVIAESHISIHTFPKRGFLTADVYTCQNGIDENYVVNYLKSKFELKDVETNLVKRGLKYPEHNLY